MSTLSRLTIGLGMTIGLAAPTLGAMPDVLDRVPDDAAMIMVVQDIGGFHEKASGLAELLDVPQAGMALGMIGGLLQTPGLNSNGNMAIAFLADEKGDLDFEAETPPMVMLLPVSDYEDFGAAFGAKDHEGAIDAISLMGESAYLRDLGAGWAAVSPDGELLAEFAGTPGNLGDHERRLGAAGDEISSSSDMFLAVNISVLAPAIREGVEGMKGQMEMMAAMMGQQAQGMEEMADLVSSLSEELIRDGRAAMMGVGIGGEGLKLDFGAQFEPGSELAEMLDAPGEALGMLANVPDLPYLVAVGLDTSSPAMKKLAARFAEISAEMNPQQADMLGMMNMSKLADLQDGFAFLMGNPPAIIGGGLFSQTLQFTKSGKPQELLDKTAKMMSDMDGMTQQGITFDTRYEQNATEIEGLPVHRWGMKMTFDPSEPSAQQAQMGMTMIFGPAGGPNGYYAGVENGLITTYSQNTPLMSQAIEAAREGGGLATSDEIVEAAGRLPDGCVMQVFIGSESIVQQASSVLAMLGMGGQLDVGDDLSPIAGGLSMREGGAVGRVFVPTDVIELIKKLGELAEQQQDVEPAPKESKPRF